MLMAKWGFFRTWQPWCDSERRWSESSCSSSFRFYPFLASLMEIEEKGMEMAANRCRVRMPSASASRCRFVWIIVDFFLVRGHSINTWHFFGLFFIPPFICVSLFNSPLDSNFVQGILFCLNHLQSFKWRLFW